MRTEVLLGPPDAGKSSSSSSSFLVIGGGGGGGNDDDDDDHRHHQQTRHHFVRTLDSKLEKLRRRRAAGGGERTVAASRKPVFVTTVKTGIFLDPPPDLAALLGLDDRSPSPPDHHHHRYYSYSSKPRVLHDNHRNGRAAAAAARKVDHHHRQPDMCKQMNGYTNIMHDKRVVRGSNFAKKTFFGKESPAAREAEARRRAMARKKAMDYQTRALRLHLGAPKLTRGRQNVDIQTDADLEELYECPPCQTFGAQTEFDLDLFSSSRTGTSTGTDACTQVDEKDLFDFDTEVTPIAESLIADAFGQAIREVLYEDELEAMARQQRALYLRRAIEEIDKRRLEHEDERLNKVMVHHAQLFDEGEKNEKARISTLTSDRITDLLPEDIKIKNSPEFVSWLVEELKEKNSESDEVLKSMINDLVTNRLDAYNKVTDVQSIPKPEELFKEIETITQQADQKDEADSR